MMTSAPKNIAILGASGALGKAFFSHISKKYPLAHVHAFSRRGPLIIDYKQEESLAAAARESSKEGPLDMVIVANGFLHDHTMMPEKSLKDLSAEKCHHLFEVNTIIPALIAKHFLPKLHREQTSFFAALSARVGSISDNVLGGWYAYRASKAALNMMIKNAAIEVARKNKHAVVVGLHPGTVESALSKPFQRCVPEGKLFTPAFAVENLMKVLENLTPENTGRCFAWDGQEILP